MYIRRRNAEPIRVKRQNKSKKVSEALFSSSFFQYLQVLLIWVVILGCDMILDMRFEYAWPCWLLMRSSHDTYKCGGLLLAIFFFAVALVADIIVYIIMPMSWVLFLGSSLVWLQFAFQADRGFCLPTVALCAIFLYVEVSIRFRDYARMYPIVAQILKPFASHCIGYPMVTIGFHIKAFISGKISQRNRLRVREKNQFYFNLVDQALPEDVRRARAAMYQNGLPNGTPNGHINGSIGDEEYLERPALTIANGTIIAEGSSQQQRDKVCTPNGLPAASTSSHSLYNGSVAMSSAERPLMSCSDSRESGIQQSNYCHLPKSSRLQSTNNSNNNNTSESWCSASVSCPSSHSNTAASSSGVAATFSVVPTTTSSSSLSCHCPTNGSTIFSSIQSSSSSSSHTLHTQQQQQSQYGSQISSTATNLQVSTSLACLPLETNVRSGTASPPHYTTTHTSSQHAVTVSSSLASASVPTMISSAGTAATSKGKSKEENILKLETENKRMKGELQSCRSSENELRSQVQQLNAQERATATEMQRLKQENESLQSRNQSLNSRLQDERNKLQSAEKRLAEERRSKHTVETQLEKEKKSRKEEVDAARQAAQVAAAQVASAKNECSEACKQRRREIDNDVKQLRRELRAKEDLARGLDAELAYLRGQVSEHKDVLSARDSLRDQQQHLSEKLREENRFKQDLLTAYHEARLEKNRLEQRVQQLECELIQMRNFVSNILSNSPSLLQPSSPPPYLAPHSAGSISPPLSMVSNTISSSSRLFSGATLDPSPPPSMTMAGAGSYCMSGPGNGATSFFTPICTPAATCCGGAGQQYFATMSSASPQLVSSPSASSPVGHATAISSAASMRAPSRGD
jgi:hypothetical protein